MRLCILLICVCSLFCSAEIVEKRLNYSIAVGDNAIANERAAASELKSYLARIYDKPIELNGNTEPIEFLVGIEACKGSCDIPQRRRLPEGFAVCSSKYKVMLFGYDDAEAAPYDYLGENGTMLSVFYFLRKYAGLKIFAPDEEHGESFIKNFALKVPEQDIPNFSFKVRGIGRTFPDYNADVIDRYAKKQLCSVPYWAHTDYYYQCINRWNKRFKDRPELFGLYDGARRNESYPLHLPCLSNPEVKQIIVNDILTGIAKRKKPVHTLRIFCDAPFRRCSCELCTARNVSNEDYFYGFILDVYDEVRKKYPELHLFLQEKSPSHVNPPTCRHRLDGIAVDLSTGLPAVTDYSKYRPLFEAWAAKGAYPMVRIYPRLPKWDSYPIINRHGFADCLRTLKGVCWGQRDFDCARGGRYKRRTPYAFVALTNYVYTNLLLDVDVSVGKLSMDFFHFMYPGAEVEIAAFYLKLEEMYSSANVNDDPLLGCYAYDKLAEPYALLQKASAKCKDRYWMDKLVSAFDEFMGYSKQAMEENAGFIEYRADAEKRQAAFRAAYPKERALHFSSDKMRLPLCPVSVLTAPFQESFVTVSEDDDNILFEVEANEKNVQRLMRRAKPGFNGSVWADDCFEIFLTGREDKMPTLQLIINANGALQALLYAGGTRYSSAYKEAGQLQVSAEIIESGWRGRILLPKKLLEEVLSGKQGKIGIFHTGRLEPLPGKNAETPVVSAFSPILPQNNYHNKDIYKVFEF